MTTRVRPGWTQVAPWPIMAGKFARDGEALVELGRGAGRAAARGFGLSVERAGGGAGVAAGAAMAVEAGPGSFLTVAQPASASANVVQPTRTLLGIMDKLSCQPCRNQQCVRSSVPDMFFGPSDSSPWADAIC